MRLSPRACFQAAVFTAGLFFSLPAAAQDYPARTVSGWTVAASTNKDGCFASRDFPVPGRTTVLLGLDIDGTNHLSVLNDNWSIKAGQRLKLDFRLSAGGYTDHFAVGIASDGKRGFAASFEEKFPAYFAASNALRVDRSGTPVEQLRLDGSGTAVAELRRCVDVFRARTTAARADSGDRALDIPRDPFATTPRRR